MESDRRRASGDAATWRRTIINIRLLKLRALGRSSSMHGSAKGGALRVPPCLLRATLLTYTCRRWRKRFSIARRRGRLIMAHLQMLVKHGEARSGTHAF